MTGSSFVSTLILKSQGFQALKRRKTAHQLLLPPCHLQHLPEAAARGPNPCIPTLSLLPVQVAEVSMCNMEEGTPPPNMSATTSSLIMGDHDVRCRMSLRSRPSLLCLPERVLSTWLSMGQTMRLTYPWRPPQPFTSSSEYRAAPPPPPPGEPGPCVLTFQLGTPVHQSPLFMSHASTTPSTIHSQGQG